MSALGCDFPKEVFARTPIHILKKVLQEIDNSEQAEANIYSMATARLTEVVVHVAHGFSGSKRKMPKTKTTDYLPYPDWSPKSEKKKEIDQETKTVLLSLLRQRRLPMYVFASLVTTPPE
jgi:hypothetical protein